MRFRCDSSRVVAWLAALVVAVALAAPAAAQPALAPWQEVITKQIQAFRDRDAPAAFSYAGSAFQVTFQNAEVFFEAIMNSGYATIGDSTSHSFGEYRMFGERGVVQEVRIIGKDQDIYGALYQLTEEEAGWRVQGVQLLKRPGLAV